MADSITADTHTALKLSKASYKYQPIESKTEIRILELHPPDPHDPNALHANLVTSKVADQPLYEAVSYAWGEPIFSETLHFPTGCLGITPNLATGLTRFRLPDRKRMLWVDAVCINQQDNLEKGHQVALMAQVFSNAKHVLAWLGEGSEETTKAIEFLCSLAENSWQYGIDSNRPLGIHNTVVRPGSAIPDALAALTFRSLLNRAFLSAFLEQAWFSRLWVVQEVALATELTLYNGSVFIERKALGNALLVFYLLMNPLILQPSDLDVLLFKAMTLIVTPWKRVANSGSLLYYMEWQRQRDCSNKLDYVYALLGLARWQNDIRVEINYEASLEQLLTEITVNYLALREMVVLLAAGKDAHGRSELTHDRGKYRIYYLPTWVTDPWGRGSQMDDFRRSEAATSSVSSVVINQELFPLIGIWGTRLQTVKKVSSWNDISNEASFPDDSLDSRGQVIYQSLVGIRQEFTSYPTGENIDSAFARTLILDDVYGGMSRNFGYRQDHLHILKGWVALESFFIADSVCSGEERVQNLEKEVELAQIYLNCVETSLCERTFIFTQSGYFGIGPELTEPGDVIATFDGASTPFVLRRVKDTSTTVAKADGDGEAEATKSPAIDYGKVWEGYEEHKRRMHQSQTVSKGKAASPSEAVESDEALKCQQTNQEPPTNFDSYTLADVKERYELIGPCYLHGFMNNESLDAQYEDQRQIFFIQ